MTKYIGVDLGGTLLKAAVVDTAEGTISGFKRIETRARDGHDIVIERMAGLISSVIEHSGVSQSQIGGIGIGVPGVLDFEKGEVVFLPNLPGNWLNVPLRQKIETRIGLPTHLINDVRSMTLAEWTFGAGKGVDTVACFAIGTGIGGGLVVNGQLHLGVNGTAGELGHQIIDMNGPKCGCGSQGCLEAFASGPAIAAMGIKAVVQGMTTNIGALAEFDLNKITPKLIYEAAMQGDEIANDIFKRAGFYIGIAVASTLAAVGPRKVVIGGGVAQAGELLLEPIRKTVRERFHVVPTKEFEIVQAALGADAGLIGAALWACNLSHKERGT